MKLFWTCFVFDSFAVLFFFFMAGLDDGTVSSFNMGLWLLLIGVPAAVLLGGLRLKAVGRPGLATLLLGLLALLGLLVGGWMLLDGRAVRDASGCLSLRRTGTARRGAGR